MDTNIFKAISPQGKTIYRLLLQSRVMTAAEIAENLHIYPHSVYRAVKPLINFGLIEKSQEYPVKFIVKQSEEALNIYLNNTRKHFLQSFFENNFTLSSTTAANKGLSLSFIQNRQDLLEQSNEDMRQAEKEVTMIVSGLVASAETILAYKRAVERGVKIRIVVQRLDESNKEMLKNWRKLGVEVRYYPLIESRILIFDSKIVYFTSYNPKNKEEGMGIRFNYSPIALLTNELFEKRWNLAKEII